MTTTRTGSGATAIRPTTRIDRSRYSIKQELTGRPVDGQQVAAVGQHGEVGQAAADVVLGHDLAATRCRRPRGCRSAGWPRAASCRRRRWPARPAGGAAGPATGRAGLVREGPGRARVSRSAARQTAPIAGRIGGFSWRFQGLVEDRTAAFEERVVARRRASRPACSAVSAFWPALRLCGPGRRSRGPVRGPRDR